MELYLEKDDTTKNIELKTPTTLKEILQNEKIIIESVILVKNNEVCLEETLVEDKDKIKLLSVVSGG
ncbi:MAG: MoaD/ThiS family protein [Candidatus Woesearchaeota archaeon]|jgi:sulfur carrier protein ThiS|nr:MoaD/ThiS family protein [Candidatus Woesearchaeota archaeon]